MRCALCLDKIRHATIYEGKSLLGCKTNVDRPHTSIRHVHKQDEIGHGHRRPSRRYKAAALIDHPQPSTRAKASQCAPRPPRQPCSSPRLPPPAPPASPCPAPPAASGALLSFHLPLQRRLLQVQLLPRPRDLLRKPRLLSRALTPAIPVHRRIPAGAAHQAVRCLSVRQRRGIRKHLQGLCSWDAGLARQDGVAAAREGSQVEGLLPKAAGRPHGPIPGTGAECSCGLRSCTPVL